jgi:hypothetical protein
MHQQRDPAMCCLQGALCSIAAIFCCVVITDSGIVHVPQELVSYQLVQLYQQTCYESSSASSAIREELDSSAALPLALLGPSEAHIRDSSHAAASATIRSTPSAAGQPTMLHRQSLALQCIVSCSSGALGMFSGTPSSGLLGVGLGGGPADLEQALAEVLDSAAGRDAVAPLRCPQVLYTGGRPLHAA